MADVTAIQSAQTPQLPKQPPTLAQIEARVQQKHPDFSSQQVQAKAEEIMAKHAGGKDKDDNNGQVGQLLNPPAAAKAAVPGTIAIA